MGRLGLEPSTLGLKVGYHSYILVLPSVHLSCSEQDYQVPAYQPVSPCIGTIRGNIRGRSFPTGCFCGYWTR